MKNRVKIGTPFCVCVYTQEEGERAGRGHGPTEFLEKKALKSFKPNAKTLGVAAPTLPQKKIHTRWWILSLQIILQCF